MARTRPELDRDAKVAQILEVAERQLRDGGYGALSVVAIARELDLAQNAVYWYFPSKDHLFVAAVERILRGVVARKPPKTGGVERQVLWFVDRLAEIEDVRTGLHDRARVSPVVAGFVAEMNATWRRMLSNVLRDRLPEDELPLAADALLAAIQGVLSQHVPAKERRRVVGFAFERLTARQAP